MHTYGRGGRERGVCGGGAGGGGQFVPIIFFVTLRGNFQKTVISGKKKKRN